ncbi:hypothetical protein [Haloquadratum walsbyi]|jgi:hypothetical protein|uniref:Uncharacterized protein n=1 Tax=Haloquadratum walsbyi J07HQW2 TaxID=1238425 RepID=U1NIU2_9EURY|nr:hypothetical protein [Haloquadratum walsbyi]ERG97150.1 MAG: hypothetical protein J07HQW2_03636 [Haloquadratum walsbyi J07HQW2]
MIIKADISGLDPEAVDPVLEPKAIKDDIDDTVQLKYSTAVGNPRRRAGRMSSKCAIVAIGWEK